MRIEVKQPCGEQQDTADEMRPQAEAHGVWMPDMSHESDLLASPDRRTSLKAETGSTTVPASDRGD